jgi:probable DNA metabolism protein
MIYIRYDGSFAGLLCALAATIDGTEPAGFLRGEAEGEGGLFAQTVAVATDEQAARDFQEHCRRSLSPRAWETLRYAFHSESPGVELLLWRYLRLGFRVGHSLERMQADPAVQPVQQLARRVLRETHRFLGFVRFREVAWSGAATVFYAAIEPEHALLPFLADHFAERMSDRPWVIHDLRRGQALFGDQGRVVLELGVELDGELRASRAEERCARLWQLYHRRLAIRERANPRLQQQLVPLRYRRQLTEFAAEKCV